MEKLCSLLIFWLHLLTVPTPYQKEKKKPTKKLTCTHHGYLLTHPAITTIQAHVVGW